MPKALTRNITRRQALSYEQSTPNRLGVTSLSEVNGRGAYRRRYAQTKRILSGKRTGAEIRPGVEETVKGYTSKQKTAMRRMSPAQRAAFAKMLKKSPAIKSVRPRRRRAKANKGTVSAKKYGAGWDKTFGKKGKRRHGAPPPPVVTPAVAAAPKRRAPRASKKSYIEERMGKGRTYRQAMADWNLSHGKTRRKATAAAKRKHGPRKYGRGRFTPLAAKVGGKTKKTYLYRTPRGKVRRIPTYAILGYPSAYAETMETRNQKAAERYVARKDKLQARRERAAVRSAARIRAGRDPFVPNPATMSWEEWRDDMYKSNLKRGRKSKGHKKLTKAQRRAISLRNLAKARKTRKTHKTHAKRTPAKKRHASSRRHVAGHKKLTKAQRRAISLRNLAKARKARRRSKGMGKFHALKGKRGRASRVTYPTRGARRVALTFYRANEQAKENRRRRRHRRNPGMTGLRAMSPLKDRSRAMRRFSRNPASNWLDGLKEALKVGGIVVVGYLSHRAVTKVVTDQVLRKLDMFKDTTAGIGKWADIIAGLAVAAAGVPLAVKLIPSESAAVGGGMAASLLHALIIKALGEAGQANVASYLSAYPDATGPAYRGISGYYRFKPHQMMNGMGEYLSMQQKPLTYGQLTQAAAGMGNNQALVTQAAAGTGEYLSYGAEAVGEYEEVPVQHVPTAMDEGIYPTLDAAEAALNVMEAAAGIGATEIPMQSTVYPTDHALPIADEPSGSRSGVFGGGGGIFGGK